MKRKEQSQPQPEPTSRIRFIKEAYKGDLKAKVGEVRELPLSVWNKAIIGPLVPSPNQMPALDSPP